MRLHWYWPFARSEELPMARSTAWATDQILIEVIDREAAPAPGERGGVTVIRDLPDVRRDAGGLVWGPSRTATYVARALARRRHWRARSFDLVHLHYINRYTDAFSPLPRPLVISVHDVLPHVPRFGARLEHTMLHRLYRRPDGIVVHHPSVADHLTARFDVPSSRVHLVEHPVLTDPAGPPPDGPPTLLLFGALRPNKGLEVMGRAMQLLREDDVRLVIAGRGHRELERRALEMAARDPRIRTEIGFISIERKAALFSECSIVALPYTTFSSQSGVLHDAYGYGRPVVVSDVGALGHSVRADGTGLVVEPGDPRKLADAVRELMRSAAWEPAAAACRAVAARRSPERYGHQLRDVYERIIG